MIGGEKADARFGSWNSAFLLKLKNSYFFPNETHRFHNMLRNVFLKKFIRKKSKLTV